MIISLRLRLLCVILIGFYDHSIASNTDRDHDSKIWKHQRISHLSLPTRHDHLSTQVKDYWNNRKSVPLKRNHFLTNTRRGLWRYGKSISHMGALHLLPVNQFTRKTHPSNFIAFKRKIDHRKENSVKGRGLINDGRHQYISPKKFTYNRNADSFKHTINVPALPIARSIRQNYRTGIQKGSERKLKIRSNSNPKIRKQYPAPIKRVLNNPKFWKNTNHVILLPRTQNKFFINHHQFLSKKGKSLDRIVVPRQNLVHLPITKKLQSIGSLRDKLRHDAKIPLWRSHQLRNLHKNVHQNTPLSGKKREQIFFVRKKPKQTNLDKFFSSKPIIKAWQNFMVKSDKLLRNNTYNEENVIHGQIDSAVNEERKLADLSNKKNRLSAIKAKVDSHASDKLWKMFLTRWKQNLNKRKKPVKGISNKSTLDQTLSKDTIVQYNKQGNDRNNTLQQMVNKSLPFLVLSSSPGRGKDKELLNRYNKQISALKNLSNTILRKQKGLKRNRFTTALLKKLHNLALKREFLTFWKKALKSHTQNVILGTKNLPIKELHALHPEEKTLHLVIKSPRGRENTLNNLVTDVNNQNGGHNEEKYLDKESIERRIEDKYDKLLKTNLPSFDWAKIKENKRKNITTDGQKAVPEISTHNANNSRHYVLHSEKLKAILPILTNEIHHEPKKLKALENKVRTDLHKNTTSNLPENYSYLFLPNAKANKKTTNHMAPSNQGSTPNSPLSSFNQSTNGTNDVKAKLNNETKGHKTSISSKHLSLFGDESDSNDTKTYTIPLKHFLNRHKPAISSKYASLFDDVLNINDEKHANTINEYIAVPKYLQMLQNNIKERKTKYNLADTKNLAGNTRVISHTPGNQYQDLYDNITDITSKLVNESEYDTQILNESDFSNPKPENSNAKENDSFLELDADESNFSYNDSTEEKDMNLRAMQDALNRNDSEQVSPVTVENRSEGSRFNHEIIVYSDNDNSTTVADITSELARDDIASIKDNLTNKSLTHFSPSINMKTNHDNVENKTISPTIANSSVLSDTQENNFASVEKEELKRVGNSSENVTNLFDGLNATRLLNDTLEKSITKDDKSLSFNNTNKDLMEESIDAMDFLTNLTVNETHEFMDMNHNVSQASNQNKKAVNDSSYTFQNNSSANTNDSTRFGDLGLFDITNMNMPDNMTVNDAYVIENVNTDNNGSVSKIGAQNTTRIESNKTIEGGNNSAANKTNILDMTQMNTKAGKNDTSNEIKIQNSTHMTKDTRNKTSKMCHLSTNMNLLRGSDCDVSGDMAIGSVFNTVKNESLGSHFGDDNEMTSAGNRKKKKINDFNSVVEENILGHMPLDNSAAKTANNSFTLIETLNSPFPLVDNLTTDPVQTSGVQMAKLDNMSVPLLSNNTGYNSDGSITTEYNFSVPILSNISFSPQHDADEPIAKFKNFNVPLLSHNTSKSFSLAEVSNNSPNNTTENSKSIRSKAQISNNSASSDESKETDASPNKNDTKQNVSEPDKLVKTAQNMAQISNHYRALQVRESTAYSGNGSEKINETTQSAPNVGEDVTNENINNKFKEVFINTTNLTEDDLKMLSEYGYNVLENDMDSKIKNKTLDNNTDVLPNLNGGVAPNEKQDINLERNDSYSDTTDFSNLGNFTSADNDLLTDLTGKDALKESEKSSAEDEEILKNVDQNIARDTDAEMNLKGIGNENFIDLKTNTLGKDLLMLGNDSLGNDIGIDENENADRKVKEDEIYYRMTNSTGASTGKTITEGSDEANQENKTNLSENISKNSKLDTNDSNHENKVVANTESKPDSDLNIKKPISDKSDKNEYLIPSNGTNAPKISQNEFYDALENEVNRRLNSTIEGLNNLNKTRSDDFSGLLIQNIVERNLSGSNKNLSIDDQFVTPIRLKAVKEEEKLVKFANQIAKRENMSNENDINNDVNSTFFKSNDTILGGNNSDKIIITHEENIVNSTEKMNEKETDNVTKEQRSLTNNAHNKTDGKDIYINFNYFINKDKDNQKEFTTPLHDIFQIEPLMNGKDINEKFLTKTSYSDIGNADQLESNSQYLKKHLRNGTNLGIDPEKYKVHLYSEDGHEDKSTNFFDENENNLYRYTVDNNNEDEVKKYSFNLNDLRESIAKIKHSAPLPNVGIPETQILKPSQQHALLEQRDFNLEPDDIEKDVPPSEEPHLHRILSYKGHSENTALLPVDYSVSNENGYWDGHVGENRPGEIKSDDDDIHEEGDTDSMEDITSLDEK